jgi:hypothetical protein
MCNFNHVHIKSKKCSIKLTREVVAVKNTAGQEGCPGAGSRSYQIFRVRDFQSAMKKQLVQENGYMSRAKEFIHSAIKFLFNFDMVRADQGTTYAGPLPVGSAWQNKG